MIARAISELYRGYSDRMTTNIEAWVIYAESSGSSPRSTDDPLFPWGWGEVIAVLPGDSSPKERAAALAAIVQATLLANGSREDLLQFSNRGSYFESKTQDGYFDALHPYLNVAPARFLRHEPSGEGELRGRWTFEVIPDNEL